MESTQLIHFPDHHEFLVAKFLFSNAPTAEIPQPVERISIFVFDFYSKEKIDAKNRQKTGIYVRFRLRKKSNHPVRLNNLISESDIRFTSSLRFKCYFLRS